MVIRSEFRCGNPESFPGREAYEFAFQFFDGSNEKIIWIQYKKKKYKRSISVRSINPLKLIKRV